MKKMVITGVNGFIGGHAKEYFEKEYEITGLDLAANYCGDRQPGDTMTYYQCNMSQESAEMAAIFTGVQPDVILHCAGSANVGASVVNPMADLDGNLHSLYQLLLALKSFEKRPQIIFLSSAGIYGNPRQLPVRESDAAAPMSPYGLHKHMAEELCEYYNRIHGYRIRSIRIFSAYGNGRNKLAVGQQRVCQKFQFPERRDFRRGREYSGRKRKIRARASKPPYIRCVARSEKNVCSDGRNVQYLFVSAYKRMAFGYNSVGRTHIDRNNGRFQSAAYKRKSVIREILSDEKRKSRTGRNDNQRTHSLVV